MGSVHLAVVSTALTAHRARLTVRHAAQAVPECAVHVLDVDGSYASVSDEQVLAPATAGVPAPTLHRLAAALTPDQLAVRLQPDLVRLVLSTAGHDATVVVAGPGVVLLRRPERLLAAAVEHGWAVVSRTGGSLPDDGLRPAPVDAADTGAYSPRLMAVRSSATALLRLWTAATSTPGAAWTRWVDVAAAALPHRALREPTDLLSSWSLRTEHLVREAPTGVRALWLDGAPVTAVDLGDLDPAEPWLLDATLLEHPRARLSSHPVLARFVAEAAAELTVLGGGTGPTGRWDLRTTSLGTRVDEPMRLLYRTVEPSGGVAAASVPDPFDEGARQDLLTWLTEPSVDGGPGRYLRALRATRQDLQRAFPEVPGRDTAAFLGWVRAHATAERYPAQVVEEALRRTPVGAAAGSALREPGVNVVGFLRGELGVGESARLMVSALAAADVTHTTLVVDRNLASRQSSPWMPSGDRRLYDTSLVCVNADLTPEVVGALHEELAPSYRIGMWYWEVEDFPAPQHVGFDHVDEVWVATEFVRRAVAPHSPVPVVTVPPPLPQRGTPPRLTRADLGLPDRPLLLFSFDFLSTMERKNPLGLVDAFRRAFVPDEGPVLVLKSINADRRHGDAERLRLAVAGMPDVLLLEEYLDASARDALVALCDVYVSLHRSEGLGLTMAEAMAWGKPVIATGYSGSTDFMDDANSFLVPWRPVPIPPGAEPYPIGGTWAEPDLDEAARLLRLVVDRPDLAAARGAQAAEDIAERHSPAASGARIAAYLASTAGRRAEVLRDRRRGVTSVQGRLRAAARRVRAGG